MKIDITSMFFNSKIEGQTATPAWGTSIGQSKQTECRIETSTFGVTDMLVGLTYKMKTDLSKLDKSKMSINREVMMCSVFDKVYANDELLDGISYVLLLVREHSDSHPNRLIVSYAPHLSYDGKSNQFAINRIREKIGCKENGCWFVHDISIVNQDELHFNSVVVDKDAPKIYKCKSQERSKAWKELIPLTNGSSKLNSSQLSYLTAIRTKPFLLLAGISGTGKSRIVRKLAQATDNIDFPSDFNGPERWNLHSPSNFCLIQVKPNWHNSMDVVGFKSNIGKEGEHYEYTPFVEFIAKAWQNTKTPFFLCLDEMNLAPVEEYFAEFLSAIESRSFGDNEEYETDPIIKPFKDFGDNVAYDMIYHLIGEYYTDNTNFSPKAERLYNKGLTLPKNLIVMGTVNMDETTFSFSRKVLDRAMSIEMNEVSYDDFLSGKTEDDIPLLTDYNVLLVERPISAQKVKDQIQASELIEYLKQVNDILEGTPFKLGYRAANEAILYAAAAKMFDINDLGAAMDDFTLMKILSRIEGDDSKLKTKDGEELLPKMLELLNKQFGEDSSNKSQTKLNQMIDILNRDHFVSFWG